VVTDDEFTALTFGCDEKQVRSKRVLARPCYHFHRRASYPVCSVCILKLGIELQACDMFWVLTSGADPLP
jgi:hypothetical protein